MMNTARENGGSRRSKLLLFSFVLVFAVPVARAQTADVSAVVGDCGSTVLTNVTQLVTAFDNPGLTYPLIFPYDAGFEACDTWFVDFSQLPDAVATIQNYSPGQSENGVSSWPLRLIKYADTGETVLQYPYFEVELLRLPAPSGFQPFQQYNEKLRIYCLLTNVNPTNYEGLVASGEWYLDPPRLCMDIWIAPIESCATYESNMEAQVEAEQAAEQEATTSPAPVQGAKSAGMAVVDAFGGGGEMMLMDSGDPCVITNDAELFSITGITVDATGATIAFESCSDHVYVVQATSDLTSGSWTDVAWMWGDDGTTAWADSNTVGQVQQFYRVVRANPNTLNNGIPYGWAVDNGLDPLDPNLASEPSTNPWAHGLTNLQV